MGTRAAIWTPRKTTILWPAPASLRKFSFSPAISKEAYVAPPPPPGKRPPPAKVQPTSAEELEAMAAEFIAEAEELERHSSEKTPSLRMQLGLLLLTSDDYIKKLLKDWDKRGKGEFQKAEFRLNLRDVGLNATSAEADALFDSWDDDKGGTLDMKELRTALTKVRSDTQKWRDAPNPELDKAKALRKRARIASEAATVTSQADELEVVLEAFCEQLQSQADVRLGALLARRRIKPGAVVTQWSKSKGAHAGELSKAEFRRAVQQLGLDTTGPYPTTVADIDAVFDSFDEDGGGWMDAVEAKAMVQGLEKAAEDAEHEKFRKMQAAQRMRAISNKRAGLAMSPLPEVAVLPPVEETAEESTRPATAPKPKRAKRRPESIGIELPMIAEMRSMTVPDEDVVIVAAESAEEVGARLKVTAAIRGGAVKGSAATSVPSGDTIDQIVLKAARRLMQVDLSRAWSTWTAFHEERLAFQSAARKLMQPLVLRAWSSWVEYADARSEAMGRLHQVLHRMTMATEIAAFKAWSGYTRQARTGRAMAHSTTLEQSKLGEVYEPRPAEEGSLCATIARCLKPKSSFELALERDDQLAC